MGFADHYLSRQKGFISHLRNVSTNNPLYIVVIPAYCEPDITATLDSLWHCRRPQHAVEIIIVVNSAADSEHEVLAINRKTLELLKEWIKNHKNPMMQFMSIHIPDMPPADAGVGLARKTGMDEAIFRFNAANNPHGFILSLDADSTCEPGYLCAIEKEIQIRKNLRAFDIYFEHPLEGDDFANEVYEGMANYELHLRYVNQFIRYTGFPFAHHTVGSCFGVRADIYAAQGGMNKRKAGEDFYFLHKVIPLGGFADICSTTVFPSARQSFRVPFGTGPAITKYIKSDDRRFMSYSPQSFLALKTWFDRVPDLYKNHQYLSNILESMPAAVNEFLIMNNAHSAIHEINKNCSTYKNFQNRFYRWFDAFKIVKFLNFSGRSFYPHMPVTDGAKKLLDLLQIPLDDKADVRSLLMIFRQIEKRGINRPQ